MSRVHFVFMAFFASLLLTSCVSDPSALDKNKIAVPNPSLDSSPKTSLDRYHPFLSQVEGGFSLVPHPHGVLSDAQKASLTQFMQKLTSDTQAIIYVSIERSQSSESDSGVTGFAVRDYLVKSGFAMEHIQMERYDASGYPYVRVGYRSSVAVGPDCRKGWDNMTATKKNLPTEHFGCAAAANLAAMISDPLDLQRPAPETPVDSVLRAGVITKYQKGENTVSENPIQGQGKTQQQ